jgi:hypothetical protein
VTVGMQRISIVFSLVVALVLGSFVLGFVSSLRLKSVTSRDIAQHYLLKAGDAPASVRTQVLAALTAFQEGYVNRNPQFLDSFMSRLFSETNDVLLMGTDADEWIRGYPAVREFIKRDWLNWGDFRLALDNAIVWSSGDVAWVASIGMVHERLSKRPVRFSAILVRNGDDWRFRKLQFQYDERDPRLSDLLRPHTYLNLLKLGLHRMRDHTAVAVISDMLTRHVRSGEEIRSMSVI